MIKPILMNTEMVKAVLAGRKTVTRRLIKPQPYNVLYDGELRQGEIEDGDVLITSTEAGKTEMIIPPYQSGDVLYVRETWCKGSLNGGAERYFYRADDNDFHCHWKPSIHMPKEAARIFLRVGRIRVGRLQDITAQQAISEGVRIGMRSLGSLPYFSCCDVFSGLWNSTIKKSDLDKYSWDANPWVWVISFERIRKEEALENA